MKPSWMPKSAKKLDLIFGIKEFLVISALGFGYSLFDGCICYTLLLVSRLERSFRDLQIQRKHRYWGTSTYPDRYANIR